MRRMVILGFKERHLQNKPSRTSSSDKIRLYQKAREFEGKNDKWLACRYV